VAPATLQPAPRARDGARGDGIPLAEGESARIQACTDAETLERWTENVIGAKTAADVLS